MLRDLRYFYSILFDSITHVLAALGYLETRIEMVDQKDNDK